MAGRSVIERDGNINIKQIDKGLKNVWKWEWLERDVLKFNASSQI
jgi:hypothetical protein